jgi:cell division transport system permease protein
MKILNTVVKNLVRHRFMTIAAIISIAMILVVFNVLINVNQIAKKSINNLSSKIHLSLYLTEETTTKDRDAIAAYITKFSEVEFVQHISKEEALKTVENKYPESADFLKQFGIENPLPESLQIKTISINDHQKILNAINESKFSKNVLRSEVNDKYNKTMENVIKNLQNVKTYSFQILLFMIITFIIAGGLIIFNALKTTLYARRGEIQIMQFVGATSSKIMVPFIFEGAILGLTAFIVGLILTYIIQLFLSMNYYGLFDAWIFLLFEAIIAISIGILTSVHAVSRYLKSKEIFDNAE